jgi:AraC family transcriptional regulator
MKDDTLRAHRTRVANAVEVIQRELDGSIRLEDLADAAGVSPFHFHRMFSAIAGEPPASYIRRLRLERAALRLLHSRHPVTDIAFLAGYETHESFTRAFKSKFGRSPQRFRADRPSLDDDLDLDATIVRISERRIACVRHVGPYDDTHAAFETVMEWARRRGLLGGGTLVGVYWDDQRITPPDRTRCEVGLYVDDYAAGDDVVGVRRLPAGDYAVLRHHGSTSTRRRAYDVLHARWLPERGRAASNDPTIEVYSSFGPGAIDLDTRVYVPLAPTRAA